jgi:hypothetical protein
VRLPSPLPLHFSFPQHNGQTRTLVIGDFNATEASLTCQWLQQAPRSGATFTAEGKAVKPHVHTLASAYSGAEGATFAASFYRGRIDHIYYATAGFNMESRLELSRDASRQLPDSATPSDHFPVGAVLTMRPLSETTTVAAVSAQATADKMQAAEAEAAALDAAWCEMEPMWRALYASAPPPAKGPPSEAALTQLRAHAQAKKELLARTPKQLQARAKALARKQ